ncbi:ABC transporter permease [Nonomuraea muscovyensis]|uniref:Putative aldouronate transport system permease protein n=1 Tax=Nonomuraea muscovyensis TaxID=1124761 RepID=A0A7X0C7A7_9ACTN|nr:ABC transporter permease subunit [Nonomuraea muscovyensis]MBB6348416.1 putative aldouronate transport system permease protein [Nonomuraea muscovyensis]MDF2708718.1 protein lplB [Nonomuraea muscovyensis]
MATDLAPPPEKAVTKARRRRADQVPLRTALTRYRWLYLMLLPGVAYFAIFKYLPMYGVTIAFQDFLPFLGYSGSPWVGFKHFEELFAGPDFGRLMFNTLLLALLHIVFVFPAPIIVALLLNELRINFLKRSVQSLIYIPHFLSWTIIASLTYILFAADFGVISGWIRELSGDTAKIDYMAQEEWFRPLIILQQLWKQTGWGTIIYLAALAGVDPNLYEAARMDGAGRFRQLWHVTLPAIRPTVVVMAILASGNLLDSGFEQIWLMTTSLNRSVADVFDTYVYYAGITQGAISYSTAVGLFKGVAGVILIFGSNWLAKRLGQRGLF